MHWLRSYFAFMRCARGAPAGCCRTALRPGAQLVSVQGSITVLAISKRSTKFQTVNGQRTRSMVGGSNSNCVRLLMRMPLPMPSKPLSSMNSRTCKT